MMSSLTSFGSTIEDRETIAACLILEAGSNVEPQPDAMIGVYNVICAQADYHNVTPARRVLYHNSRGQYSFSCMRFGRNTAVAKAKRHANWNLALWIIDMGESGWLGDITDGAYHFDGKKQDCFGEFTVRIGNHKFFKRKDK